VGQEEKSCRNNWRSGKQDLRGKVKRTQVFLAQEQVGYRENMSQSLNTCMATKRRGIICSPEPW